jgi:hypothetical protein
MFEPAPRAAINKKQLAYLIDISTNITRHHLDAKIAVINCLALHHFVMLLTKNADLPMLEETRDVLIKHLVPFMNAENNSSVVISCAKALYELELLAHQPAKLAQIIPAEKPSVVATLVDFWRRATHTKTVANDLVSQQTKRFASLALK